MQFVVSVRIYLFMTFPAESIEKQFDAVNVLGVDGKMQRVASHVVNAIDVDATMLRTRRSSLPLISNLQYVT